MSNNTPILVTGAAGNVGSVGRGVVKLLRERDLQVRALVHRLDERSQVLSEMGAELVVADLTVTISSSYGYCSSRSERNPRLRDSREHLTNDSFADESN
jgi:nucleoside-diphosphate-sugar epimerase